MKSFHEEIHTNKITRREVTNRLDEILEEGGSIISLERTYKYEKNREAWSVYEIFWKK